MARLGALLLLLAILACDPPPLGQFPPLSNGRPEGQFSKVDRVELATLLWGLAAAPGLEGAAALAFDAATGTLYATRGGSGPVLSVDQGGVRRVFDLDAPPAQDAVLLLDPEQKRLIWVGFPAESVRWLDLATGEVVGRRDPDAAAPMTREALYSHRQAALDHATGWVWVADPGAGRVVGYGPDGESLLVPALRKPVALAAGADGRLWILDALSRDEVRLAAFTPATLEVKEVRRVRVPHWFEGPPALLVPHRDGRMSVIGHQGATLDREYWPTWWDAIPAPAWPLGAVETGRFIAVLHLEGGKGGQPVVAVVEAATGELLYSLPQPSGTTIIVAAGPGKVAVAGETGSARIYDIGQGRESYQSFAFALTADKVLSVGTTLVVLDRAGGALHFRRGEGSWGTPVRSANLIDVSLFAAGSRTASAGGQEADFPAEVQASAILLAGGHNPWLFARNLEDADGRGPSLSLGEGSPVWAGSIALSPGGPLAATLLPDRGEVVLADLESFPWTVRWRTLLPGLGPGAEVIFDPSRGRVLVGSPEGWLWATATGRHCSTRRSKP
ncbi:hypothetical protein IIA16_05580 [bacterium]|nr:hypothetical protein [bacterium]